MPTPTERLEARRQLMECRVCAWLETLDAQDRREWSRAIANPRYGGEMIASEIRVDITASGYAGPEIGESSIRTHRRKAHA